MVKTQDCQSCNTGSNPVLRTSHKELLNKARKPFKTCYKCYEVLEGRMEDDVPDSCNDCENFNDMIKLSDVEAFLQGYARREKLLDKLIEKLEMMYEEPETKRTKYQVIKFVLCALKGDQKKCQQ